MDKVNVQDHPRLSQNGLNIVNLWYKGNLDLLNRPSAAVIGTRNPSELGRLHTEKICKILVERGFTVVSGLAAGVDAASHEAAFKYSGKTVAVLPTPLDKCYPRENEALKKRIEEEGLVISQFKKGSRVFKSNFIIRNRLMAAVSQMTIVTEASVRSGTRHQVEACLKLERPVGFLSSLAEMKYPWVQEAIQNGSGFVIDDPEILSRMLDSLSSFK
jgi:DNA processing protein